MFPSDLMIYYASISLLKICLYLLYVNECHVCMCADESQGVRSLKIGVIDGNELPYGFWELNPGLLQEPQVLLTSNVFLQLSLQLSVILLITWH